MIANNPTAITLATPTKSNTKDVECFTAAAQLFDLIRTSRVMLISGVVGRNRS
jgi:hypothetical protein